MLNLFNQIRYQIIVALLFLYLHAAGQPFDFTKVNSGTKSDIRTMYMSSDQKVFFLTDKIYQLDQDHWKRVDFPIEGKIGLFYPVSSKDIWFSVDRATSTSMPYHYHGGLTENVRSPFVNQITAISFAYEKTGWLASLADIAAYDNGRFRSLPPVPTRNCIQKLFPGASGSFWAMTNIGELFRYEQGTYTKISANKEGTDFCATGADNGFFLSEDELYQVRGKVITLAIRNDGLKQVRKIGSMNPGLILLVGDHGLTMVYSHGQLTRINPGCDENLNYFAAKSSEDIWIGGENGRLLYHGKNKFPAYQENNQGFSTHKLISYGISTDDEYGVGMADLNGDDKTDIYAVRISEQNRLYINNLKSSNMISSGFGFTEEAVKRNANGVLNPGIMTAMNELKLGICIADIDNDKDQDIYLCYLNSNNKLLINRGNGYFRNVSEQKNRATENLNRSNSAAFADVDLDGDLDRFVANEEGSNRLFENNGTGQFTDITQSSGLESSGGGMCASFGDVNGDGKPDLCVSFWYPSNKLYVNRSEKGRIFFQDVTSLTDIAKAPPSKSNAVTFADVNNDGFTDLFIANRNNGNKLYINDGKGIFADRTTDYFSKEDLMSNGAVFADFDLDGFQDLYITNVGENVLYRNIQGKYFEDVTAAFGVELSGYCTGCATGDVDNDGDPDLYVANYINGNSKLFLNISERKTFVKLLLHGIRSNRDAIGAKVWLYQVSGKNQTGVLSGFREMTAGNSYGSVSEKEMIFGVEPRAVYYALIKFPSTPDTLRIEGIFPGQSLEVEELTGFTAYMVEGRNYIVRFFTDSENQQEILKYMTVFLLLAIYNISHRNSIRNIIFFRWLTSGVIFLIFMFINQFFLFRGYSLSFFIAPLIALGLLVILHLFTGRILLRRLALKEKQELREKLSRDLHDDLASTLGSISIYAETLKGMDEPSPSDFKKLSVKIAGLTQSALQSISDIIWMTSPRNDSLQSLISKTSNYMLEILTDNNINFNSEIDIPEEPIILRENIRNDGFLILKEALHNIIRHSGANRVEFKAAVKENRCRITMSDNGSGFSESRTISKGSHGNGLINMRKRARESEIDFILRTTEGEGTEIEIKFRI